MHPFVCLACGKGFKYDHSLKFHIKSYHGLTNDNNSLSTTTPSTGTLTSLVSTSASSGNGLSLSPSSSINNMVKKVLRSSSISTTCSVLRGSNRTEGTGMSEEHLVIDQGEKERRREAGCEENTSDGHVSEDACDVADLKVPSSGGGIRSNGDSNLSNSSPCASSPSNSVSARGIQIKSEKVLISILEGIHSQSDQSYLLYKCCLCGFAFPCLEPMVNHVQTMHSNVLASSSLTCDKCGACFRWKSELQLHEQLHQAMEHQTQGILPPSSSTTSSNATTKSSLSSILPPHINSLGSLTSHLNGLSLPNLVMFNPFGLSSSEPTTNMNNNTILSRGASDSPNPLNGNSAVHNITSRDSGINRRKDSSSSSMSSNHVNGHVDTFSEQVLNLSKSGSSKASGREPSMPEVDSHPSDSPTNMDTKRKLFLESVVRSQLESSKMEDGLNLLKFAGRAAASLGLTGGNGGSNGALGLPHHSVTASVTTSPSHHTSSPSSLVPSGKVPSPLGEIEETSPGQFKCRYCDKTFDRIFSVHRHERVHTGYKPCVCKVCGRGFSEKRNLRHHIIRFHSDGSGRELLKRARKDKSLAASTKQLAASVLKNAAFAFEQQYQQQQHHHHQMQHLHSSPSPGMSVASVNSRFDVKQEPDLTDSLQSLESRDRNDSSRLLRRIHGILPSDERSQDDHRNSSSSSSSGHIEPRCLLERNVKISQSPIVVEGNATSVITRVGHPSSSITSPSSSSRRRKGKPSKKIMRSSPSHHDDNDDDDDSHSEQGQLKVVEDDDKTDEEVDANDLKGMTSKTRILQNGRRQYSDDVEMDEGNEKITNDMDEDGYENEVKVNGNRFEGCHLSASDNSNGGNQSDNSIEDGGSSSGGGGSSSSRVKGHGAFFSSYSPRLGIVEKPIKRQEVCRPLLGPDGKYLYPCGYCQKTFCSLSDLNRHMNFHEDVRPFKCEFCEYQSRTNSQLKVHMMRHAGIKQFLCQTCNYNGVTQSDLNRHCKTRSHILRSANVCSLCSLGFSTKLLLQDHLDKFHEMRGYTGNEEAPSPLQVDGILPNSLSSSSSTSSTPPTTACDLSLHSRSPNPPTPITT